MSDSTAEVHQHSSARSIGVPPRAMLMGTPAARPLRSLAARPWSNTQQPLCSHVQAARLPRRSRKGDGCRPVVRAAATTIESLFPELLRNEVCARASHLKAVSIHGRTAVTNSIIVLKAYTSTTRGILLFSSPSTLSQYWDPPLSSYCASSLHEQGIEQCLLLQNSSYLKKQERNDDKIVFSEFSTFPFLRI